MTETKNASLYAIRVIESVAYANCLLAFFGGENRCVDLALLFLVFLTVYTVKAALRDKYLWRSIQKV